MLTTERFHDLFLDIHSDVCLQTVPDTKSCSSYQRLGCRPRVLHDSRASFAIIVVAEGTSDDSSCEEQAADNTVHASNKANVCVGRQKCFNERFERVLVYSVENMLLCIYIEPGEPVVKR